MTIEDRFLAAGRELRDAELEVALAVNRYEAANRAFDRVAQRRRTRHHAGSGSKPSVLGGLNG